MIEMAQDSPLMLTPHEAAEILRVSPQHVYSLAAQGLIPCVRVGRAVRIERVALTEFIRTGGRTYAGGWKRQASSPTVVKSSGRRGNNK